MPTPMRPFSSLSEFDDAQLANFETMHKTGVAVAIPAALDYCAKNGLSAPPWLLAASTDLLCDLLRREISSKRGRSCGFVARYRQDMIDYSRWDQVVLVRQKQGELREEVADLRARPHIPPAVLQERERMLAWVGSSLNRAFECAAMILQGSEAYGSPEAMKRSYSNVNRNNRSGDHAFRYHLLSPAFLKKLGLQHETRMRPGRKPARLYELTL